MGKDADLGPVGLTTGTALHIFNVERHVCMKWGGRHHRQVLMSGQEVLQRQIADVKNLILPRQKDQNGFITTRITIATIAKVGTSLIIRKYRDECLFSS